MPRKPASVVRSAPRHAAATRVVAPSSGEPAELPGKGHQTRQAILDCALQMAGRIGLEGLSIGMLADRMDMSKSGVFAHFGSREELQISVIRRYHSLFEAEVFYPALEQPRGLPRLHMLFDRWVQQVSREVETGCIYISGAVEFDDRPGPVRDALVLMVQTWHDALLRAVLQAIEVGHLQAKTPAQLLTFELHGQILALHHDSRLLRAHGCVELAQQGYQRLIGQYATPTGMKLLQTLSGGDD